MFPDNINFIFLEFVSVVFVMVAAGNRTVTVEQMDANVEAMVRDLQEILRIGEEQKRL